MTDLPTTIQLAAQDIDHFLAQASCKQGPAGAYLLWPLPAGWHFGHDFPHLPPYLDNAPAQIGVSHPSLLLDLPFHQACFVFSAADQSLNEADLSGLTGEVVRGVNFLALQDTAQSSGAMVALWPAVNALTGRDMAAPRLWQGTIDDELTLFMLTSLSDGPSTLGPLTMADLSLSLLTSLADPEGATKLTLLADFTVGKSRPVRLTISATLAIGDWSQFQFEGRFEGASLANLAELSDLAGHSLEDNLPPSLQGLANYAIQSFTLGLAPTETNKITRFSFELAPTQPASWDLIAGVLAVQAPTFRLIALDPLSPGREIILTIEDNITVGGGQLDLTAQVPVVSPDGAQLPTVTATLPAGQSLPLDPFLQHILPFQTSTSDKLAITSLDVNGDFAAKEYTFDLGLSGQWPLIGQELVLEQLELSLVYSGGQKGSAAGTATATLKINDDLELTLLAEMPQSNEGWKFSGRTAPLTLSSQSLQQSVSHLFGLSWPNALGGLTLESLYVVFDAAAKDFLFLCKGQLPIESATLATTLTIDLRYQATNQFKGYFGGFCSLTLEDGDELDFELIVESGPQANTFIAAYEDKNGKSRPVSHLIAPLSPDWAKAIPPSLAFVIREAMLARRADGPNSRWLFSVGIDGNLNLSDIHLPDLPLVGSTSAANETLALSFQLRLPSKPFQADDVKALNALLPDKGLQLPETAINGTTLATLLQIGDSHLPLSLPIAANQGNSGPPLLSPPGNATSPAPPNAPAADATQSDGTQWVKVQKKFGPVHIERVGLAYREGQLMGLLDAALTAGGLTISLDGLTVSSPLSPISPTFGLHGLGIDYRNGPLELAGSFLRQATENGTEYDGLALLRTEALTLGAIGSYASLKDGSTSLFIYAVLDYPLGGPSFFFVTGLAAGFGYNRRLVMPTIDQVATFPLVVEAVNGPPSLPAGTTAQQTTITNQLTQLGSYVPVAVGENFLAIGLKFTSFKLIDSFALLVVQFGQRFEVDLLGLSTLVVPAAEASSSATPLAEAQLALRARFVPDEGILQVQAQLTNASYVLSRDCHLTGGFAFYSWFKGDKAGDFVLTLGGYHPRFTPPDYYPQVPRLGLNWRLNDNFSIKGQAYFALTGHALMAGGSLEATWQSGAVYAHFVAGADFLITWQPYHYDIELYISISAGVTVHIFGTHHLSFDAGADLHLWGPEFAGHAHVHLKVWVVTVSFDISFGGGAARLRPIDWATFGQAFLPKDSGTGALQICSVAIGGGLIRQMAEGEGAQRWIVNSKELCLTTNSVIPANRGQFGSQSVSSPNMAAVGVQPMGILAADLNSLHTVEVRYDDDARPVTDCFVVTPILKNVPAGMWAEPVLDGEFLQSPGLDEPRLVNNALSGFELRLKRPAAPDHTQAVARRDLQFETEPVPEAFQWETIPSFTVASGQQGWQQVEQTIHQNGQRDQLLAELGLDKWLIDLGQPLGQDMLAGPMVGQLE